MRLEFTAGMVTGFVLGGLLSTVWFISRPQKATITASSSVADIGIEDFMFPDAKLEDIYHLTWIQELLNKPSGATFHLRSSEGSIRYGDFRFASEGTAVAADEIEPLSRTLRAMNAYQVGLGLACGYNPGAVLRIEGGGHHLDFLICFQCRLADWYADGQRVDQSIAPRVGFSDLGFRVLRRIITKVYPDKLHLSDACGPEPTEGKRTWLSLHEAAMITVLNRFEVGRP